MKRAYIPFILSGILFLAGAIILYRWLSSFTSWTLQEHLQTYSPLFLEITFFLVIIAIGSNVRCFKALYTEIPQRVRVAAAAIVIAGLVLVALVAPRVHRIYYDEDIYQNIGQNIAYLKSSNINYSGGYLKNIGSVWKNFIGRAGMCNEGKNEYGEYTCFRLEYNKEPNGWPYILSVVYRLFGISDLASFLTNNFLFVLSIIMAVCSAYLLFNSFSPALYAALLLALIPEALLWSNTAAVEPSAACLASVAVCCALLFIKNRTTSALFLAVVVAAFAVQFRPESLMIAVVAGLILLFWAPDELTKGRFYLCAAIFFLLIIPHIVHLYAVKDIGWGSTGPKFSLKYFQGNFRSNFLHYMKNQQFPLLTTILFIAGIVLKINNSRSVGYPWREKIIPVVWFLLFWGIFIFFYAGSYTYGADVRFALLSYVPIAMIAGYGAAALESKIQKKVGSLSIRYLLVTVIIVSFMSFLPFVRTVGQEAWAARADHKYAQEMAKSLPQDSLVLTHNPNMFLFWGQNAAQASLATEQTGYFNGFFQRYKGGIYFHYNFWCNVPDPLQNSFCKNILERYKCTAVMTFKERDYTFVLYKVEK
jgi:hypothetical protein